MKHESYILKGKVRCILTDVNTGEKEVHDWVDNQVMNAGIYALLDVLGGLDSISNPGKITYGAVGSGTVSIAATDTTLDTELERALVSVSSRNGNELTIRVFFTTAQANGTITNFGWFGEDASAAADSGTLFNKVAISIVKTSAKTLTIEQKFTQS